MIKKSVEDSHFNVDLLQDIDILYYYKLKPVNHHSTNGIIQYDNMTLINIFVFRVTMLVGPLVNIVLVYIRKDLLPFLVILVIAFAAFATGEIFCINFDY